MAKSGLPPLRAVRKLQWVFGYYASHFLDIRGRGQRLEDGDGGLLGYLDEIRLWQGRIHFRGWIRGGTITVSLNGMTLTRSPTIERRDVAQHIGIDAVCGFEGSLPLPAPGASRRLEVTVSQPQGTFTQDLVLPGRRQEMRARARLARKFVRDCLPISRLIIRALRTNDPQLRRHIKLALGLNPPTASGILERDMVVPGSVAQAVPTAAPQDPCFSRIIIVMPVYNAFSLLPEALGRIAAHTDLPWHLVVIEDCSTDARVRPFLRDWVQAAQGEHPSGKLSLLENDSNLGFIASVNRGFAKARALDPESEAAVVLLNSDAFVPAGWASRLLAPMQRAPDVASVTPMSNDAEIFSVPVICTRSQLAPGQGDALDRAAAMLPEHGSVTCEVPTGVGFCMALSPRWLARFDEFDAAFGRGYGEEVDWCRKTAAQGARHLATARLFVEHRGGESFGADNKAALVAHNNAIIATRYPGYDAAVQTFILTDPLLSARMMLALSYLETLPETVEVPVWIAHSLGGGAEEWLQFELARLAVRAAVIIRLGGPSRYRVEIHAATGVIAADCDDPELVVALTGRLSRRRVIYSCGVGDPDPASIPALLLALTAGGQDQPDAPLDILFHDFLPLSPSYTLLDSDGVFRGTPLPGHDDRAHCTYRPDGTLLDLADWQALWAGAVAKAARLVVFSDDSRAHVVKAFPHAAGQIMTRPHELRHSVPRLATQALGDERQVIGVLGNIGLQKGAAVLQALGERLTRHDRRSRKRGRPARSTARKDLPRIELVVIGRVDPAYHLGPRATIHGAYQVDDLPGLVARYGITCWLIPSIWPETFSFTTHECLATGLPVMAFDIGAQGAAVATASNGIVLALPTVEKRNAATMAVRVLGGMRKILQRKDTGEAKTRPGSGPAARNRSGPVDRSVDRSVDRPVDHSRPAPL